MTKRHSAGAPLGVVDCESGAVAVIPAMSTKKREVIWGGRIMGAEIRARQAGEGG
ncbi:MAG: hypothetical protein ACJ8EL_21700 [Rhizomicrobium sp.]